MNFSKFYFVLASFLLIQTLSLSAFAQSSSLIEPLQSNFSQSSLFSNINDANFSANIFSSNSQTQDLINISQSSVSEQNLLFNNQTSQSSSSSSSSTSSISSQIATLSIQELTGEIQSIQSNVLTVKIDDKTTDFVLPNDIKITRNTLSAKVTDLEPRDQVTIVQTGDSRIISIEASAAGQVSDASKFVIPAVIILILFIALALYFLNQSKKGKIKTTTTNLE